MDDVLLLFPPAVLSAIDGPHLAPAQLSAYLEGLGLRARCLDLNIRFFRHLMSRERITAGLAAIRALATTDDADWLAGRATSQTMARIKVRDLTTEAVISDNEPRRYLAGRWQTTLRAIYGEALDGMATQVDLALTAATNPEGNPFGVLLAAFINGQETFLERVTQARLIGINLSFSCQLQAVLQLAAFLERNLGTARPACVLGGTQVSLLSPKDRSRLTQAAGVDALALYEGERPLAALVAHLRTHGRTNLTGLPNLCTPGQDTPVVLAEPIPPAELPTPRFEEEDLRLYFTPRMLPVYVSRGCYWGRCTFCDYTKLYTPGGSRFQERPPQRVVEDLAQLARYGIGQYRLISEAVSPGWFRRFAPLMIASGPAIQCWSYVRNESPRLWTPELLHQMYRAGVRYLTCGVESTSDRVLSVINKGSYHADVLANLQAFAAAGIKVTMNLIPDYPTTTLAEAAAGASFVLEHMDMIPSLNHQFFELSAQSAIAADPEGFGVHLCPDLRADSRQGSHALAYRHRGLEATEHHALITAYDSLAQEVMRHQVTREVMLAIDWPGRSWTNKWFTFAEYHLAKVGGGQAVCLIEWRLGAVLRFPAHFAQALAELRPGHPYPFTVIRAAFPENAEPAVQRLLRRMAGLGFIERVWHRAPLTTLPEALSVFIRHG